ncbi:MAG: hypothetical protein ACE5F1_20320 [Planctomycetota bacterium]
MKASAILLLVLLVSGCTRKEEIPQASKKAPQKKERYLDNGAALPAPFAADRHLRSQIKAQKEQARKRRQMMNQVIGR